jgi:hypothetical protein
MQVDEDSHPKNMGMKKRNWWEKLKDTAGRVLKGGGAIANFVGDVGQVVGAATGQPEIIALAEGLKLGGGLAKYAGNAFETGEMEEEKNREIYELGKRAYASLMNRRNIAKKNKMSEEEIIPNVNNSKFYEI